MAGQGRARSLESWKALTPGNRRRWIRAFGNDADALAAYRAGQSLTSSQRGHAFTPERPSRALSKPWLYPKYVATHTSQLNETARSRGIAQHGAGPRGESVTSYEDSGGDYTWVVPDGTLNLYDWRFSTVFRSEEEAQLFARRSWAPAGVVIIVDRGEGHSYRWEVWFGYPESRGKPTRTRGGKTRPPDELRSENIARLRAGYEGRKGRSIESWNALSEAERRRWIKAYGDEDRALEAWRNGLNLSDATT